MNNPSEQATTSASLVPIDPERRALEERIELAKRSLIDDLNRVSRLAKRAAGTAGRSVVRVAALGVGLVVVGLVAAFVRRRRRFHFKWK